MASDTRSEDISGEYASILGANPEKYQKQVFVFQVSFYVDIIRMRFNYSSSQIRNIKRLHWLEWAFFLLAIPSVLGTLGLTIERIVHTKEHDRIISTSCVGWKCDPDFTFAILLIVNLGKMC